MSNIFALYEGKKLKKAAERQLRLAFKSFSLIVSEIQERFKETGSQDTVSREVYSDWVIKQINDGKLM